MLVFPTEVIEQHLVVLGKTGAGKSSALRHIVEHLLKHKKRTCILDPKGDWWGLKLSADGKSEGFPVIAFGDFKEPKASDIPINAQSGKHVAELIATGNRPCIIGFRGWMTSHMVQFWIDFASTLFNMNSGELYLVGDEFHNFAPKGKIMDPQAGKCLHWSNRLLSEGRGLGIVCLLASQRPQKVHNDTLTSCETLVAMRVIHAADRNAVQDWIEGCGDTATGKEVLNSLASMDRGEAYVWSPEIGFGPKRLKFPMFHTFDSFAPPQLQKKTQLEDWSNVDLEEVRTKLASVIEEAKANDPAELKRTIADLKRKLSQAEQKQPEIKQSEPIEIPVLDSAAKQLLENVQSTCIEVLGETRKRERELELINAWLKDTAIRIDRVLNAPKTTATSQRIVLQPKSDFRPKPTATSNGTMSPGEIRILCAVAQYPDGVSSTELKVLTGYRATSTYEYSRSLVARGYATRSGESLYPTNEGISALGSDYEPLPTGIQLQEFWRRKLTGGELKIMECALSAYPAGISQDQIKEWTGFKDTSCYEYTRSLVARRVLERDGRTVRANARFF